MPRPTNRRTEPNIEIPGSLIECRDLLEELRMEGLSLAAEEGTDPGWSARFAQCSANFVALSEHIKVVEAKAKSIERMKAQTTSVVPGYDTNFAPPGSEPSVIRQRNPWDGDIASLSRGELRSHALHVLEAVGDELDSKAQDRVDSMLRSMSENFDGGALAKRLLITERQAYRSAFMKYCRGYSNFTDSESRAIDEFRDMLEGTGAAGGFGVPVLIDPSIILVSGAAAAPIVAASRNVTITTNVWKGVNSAPPSWSFDPEGASVSDDSPTLSQPTIPVYMARGFVPFSIEVGMDYPDFAGEISRLLSAGYLDILAQKTAIGAGGTEPTGIFTAMQNATTSPAHVLVTTKGSFGAVDVRKAWSALPERFRTNASWAMSIGVETTLLQNASALSQSDLTTNPLLGNVPSLFGRPVIISDYCPSFVGTTGAESFAVVGDFQNFLIVSRAGMTVELVQHLLGTTTGRPTGERGMFAFARVGSDVTAAQAFRLISNT
jgi:HK97 family phage major capsid protein